MKKSYITPKIKERELDLEFSVLSVIDTTGNGNFDIENADKDLWG